MHDILLDDQIALTNNILVIVIVTHMRNSNNLSFFNYCIVNMGEGAEQETVQSIDEITTHISEQYP